MHPCEPSEKLRITFVTIKVFYKPTPWYRAFLEKVIFIQLLKKCPDLM